jgi:hypothetical protein
MAEQVEPKILEQLRNEDRVDELIVGRESVYGEPVQGMSDIAKVWSGILGYEVEPVQVALCFAGAKLVRASQTPDYSDNMDDVVGYLDIARKVVGEEMIVARSVDDYLQQKNRRGKRAVR